LIAPGVEGYFGIMANRAPIVSQLDIGVLQYRTADGHWEYVAVGGGFLEAAHNRVIVLAETAELSHEIDVQRAQEAKDRALHRLASGGPNVDIERAQAALRRALARLDAAQRRESHA
jgi:F-type H+-transporting ATPase subunit epsilon